MDAGAMIVNSGTSTRQAGSEPAELKRLRSLGYQSIEQFQVEKGLTPDGIIGPKTRESILAEWRAKGYGGEQDVPHDPHSQAGGRNSKTSQEIPEIGDQRVPRRHALSAVPDVFYQCLLSLNNLSLLKRIIIVILSAAIVGPLFYLLLCALPRKVRRGQTDYRLSLLSALYLLIFGILYQCLYLYDLWYLPKEGLMASIMFVLPLISYIGLLALIRSLNRRSLISFCALCLVVAWGHMLYGIRIRDNIWTNTLTQEEYDIVYYQPTRFVTLVAVFALVEIYREERRRKEKVGPPPHQHKS